MEAVTSLAGSLLVSMVVDSLPAYGVWELLLQGSYPCRRASLACKTGFPYHIGTVIMLPWCFNCLSFVFYHGGHSFVSEGLQLIWGERKENGKLPEQFSGILCPQTDFPFFPHTPRSISFSNRHHPLFPLVLGIPGCCCLFDFLFLLPLSVYVT